MATGDNQLNAHDRFVHNIRADGSSMVHSGDCPTIQHQVRQESYPVAPNYLYFPAGVDSEGNELLVGKQVEEHSNYSAHYATTEELAQYPRKYLRCKVCSPDVPESPMELRQNGAS